MKKYIIFTIAAIFLTASAVFSQEQYVKPIDEAGTNPSFAAFRSKLIAAVKRKDAKYVLSIIAPKKRNYGEGGGIAEFKKEWANLKKESRFWLEVLPVISNGGVFSKGANEKDGIFWAPYLYDVLPPELDATEYEVIIGRDVELRAEPNLDAEIVGKLSYNIVTVDRDEAVMNPTPTALEQIYMGEAPKVFFWMKVTTLGGKTGFVSDEFIRSPFDYRASFERKRGKWLMTAFVAGTWK